MATATFRFHQELEAFLPRERRGRAFAAECARQATTKHMIEALGVPHTEVETILVNGEASGFDRILRDGDHVAVYACFVQHMTEHSDHRDHRDHDGHDDDDAELAPHGELPSRAALRRLPRERMRFVADSHLGGLARLLRMAGYDTLYDNGYHDDEVEALAREDGRIVLTRDRELLKRRAIVHGCYIHALDPGRQLRELVERLDLAHGARPFSLCLHCNMPLRAVDKAGVAERLPASVRALHDSFTTCDACHRVYWKGSHYRRMAELLATLAGCDSAPQGGLAEVESPHDIDVHPRA